MSLTGQSSTQALRRLMVFGVTLIVLGAGCNDDERRVNGVVCASSDQCVSGLCYNAVCLDPMVDDDGDGLLNAQEAVLGTHPFKADTDGDGPNDAEEVGDDLDHPRDADGDNDPGLNNLHDALESMIEDRDGDCIEDQFDPENDQREKDMRIVAELACPHEGVCGDPDAQVTALCDDSVDPPQRLCDFSAVPAYDDDPNGETTCDALDNDCDGFVDEGIGHSAVDGKNLTLGEACSGVGVCSSATGVVECHEGGAICSVNADGSSFAGALTEVSCNNLDDDCDGVSDEGVVFEDPASGDTAQIGGGCNSVGVCAFGSPGTGPGLVECALVDGVETALCSTGPGGSADLSEEEICDTLDNDCDGAIDEGIAWTDDDGVDLDLGSPCGLGVCAGGEVMCVAGEAACSTSSSSSGGAESCNDLDDDCDGQVDEADGLELNCPALGVCADLEPTKVGCNNQIVFCSYVGVDGYEAIDESSCNGLDDDCDGEVDEGLSAPSGAILGAPCQGQGACAAHTGEVVCGVDAAGEPAALCSADLDEGTAELCNGADDDCDGVADEDATGVPLDLGCLNEGVCAGQEESGAVCQDGVWVCAYAVVENFEDPESTCDAQDNDCDGQIDEGVPKAFDPSLISRTELQPAHRGRWPVARAPDGTIYLFGGLHTSWGSGAGASPGVVLGDLWSLDPTTVAWTLIDDGDSLGPGPRFAHAVAWSSQFDAFLVQGGLAGTDDSEEALSDLWAYHPDGNTWQLVTQSTEVGASPARAWHTMTAVSGGGLVLAGGDPDTGTLIGTLGTTETPDDLALGCSWTTASAGPADRARHAAVYHPGEDALWLVGGESPDDPPLAILSLDVPDAWMSPVSAANPLPVSRVDACAVVHGDDVFVFGGRTVTPGASLLTSETHESTWRLTADGASVEASLVPADPPEGGRAFAGCGAFEGDTPGVVHVLAGAANASASWTSTSRFDASSQTWLTPSTWAGPPPRHGAAIAVRASDGAVWALGGIRAPAAGPLQDAWRRESDGSWTALVDPLDLGAAGVDKTRPALAHASALWDAVGERILLYGGTAYEVAASKASTALWAFLPTSGDFKEMDDQGIPPAGLGPSPIFANQAAGDAAWLAGVSSAGGGGDGLVAGTLSVFDLDLSVLAWAANPSATKPVGVSQTSRSVVGGVSKSGLEVLHLMENGALVAATYDGASWISGALVAEGPYGGFLSGVYDPMTRTTTAWVRDADDELVVLSVDHQTFNLTVLDLGIDLELWTDTTLVLSPSLGALGVGGRDGAGVTRSAQILFGQSCP